MLATPASRHQRHRFKLLIRTPSELGATICWSSRTVGFALSTRSWTIAFGITLILVTYLHVIFGEMTSRTPPHCSLAVWLLISRLW